MIIDLQAITTFIFDSRLLYENISTISNYVHLTLAQACLDTQNMASSSKQRIHESLQI